MENRIYQIKDKLLTKIEEETKDMDRLDVKEVGELIDAVHHLAETEYYCSVADAMWAEKHGYSSGTQRMPMTRSGYTERQATMYNEPAGYHDIIEKLGEEYRNLSRDEKMAMKNKVLTTLGSM